MGILDLLTQAVQANQAQHDQHFNQISQQAPPDLLSKGLSAAFASNQTPAVGNMVSQLFGQSNNIQQAGLLNQLVRSLGPTVLATLAGGALSKMMQPGQTQFTPEQAAKVSPQTIEAAVNEAHAANPSVTDHLGDFYAQHKGLVNTLGGIAATIALMKMKDSMSDRS
jgi:hypothetical protein